MFNLWDIAVVKRDCIIECAQGKCMKHATNIADKLLGLARADNNTLTPMQVLKLVYIAHGWMLGIFRRPLICESIQAWRYGPVVRDLYDAVREFKSNPVIGPLSKTAEILDQDEEWLVQSVYEAYKHFTAIQLSAMTHAVGSPWYITWADGQGMNHIISNDLIEEHYKRLTERNQNAQA